MANSPTLIELPELGITLISQHLSYEDLRNLRVTCKQLKKIVVQRTPRSLHLFVRGYPFERELFHSGELIDYANTFHVPGHLEVDQIQTPLHRTPQADHLPEDADRFERL